MKLCHRDMLVLACWSSLLRWAIFFIPKGKAMVPTKLASGKKQDIS